MQYWRRLGAFDFDMIQWTWAVLDFPGQRAAQPLELAGRGAPGSLNYRRRRARPPSIAMIEAMLAARAREDFVSAVRAFDRVLLSGFYVVPLFHAAGSVDRLRCRLETPVPDATDGAAIELWWRERPN